MNQLCNWKLPVERIYQVLQTCNLDVLPMNIYEKNSARNMWLQSDGEWTLVPFFFLHTLFVIKKADKA